MADSQNWLFYPTKSLQKELGFLLQNCGAAQFLKFGLEMPKSPKNSHWEKIKYSTDETFNSLSSIDLASQYI